LLISCVWKSSFEEEHINASYTDGFVIGKEGLSESCKGSGILCGCARLFVDEHLLYPVACTGVMMKMMMLPVSEYVSRRRSEGLGLGSKADQALGYGGELDWRGEHGLSE
jgi:hypothetical protein